MSNADNRVTHFGEAFGGDRPVRILRVIARMNVGGPAHHVSLLSGRLDPQRFVSLLVHGETGPGEASLAELARTEGVDSQLLRSLGPEIRPWADLRALWGLVRLIRRYRPDIVETHTAKAGMLGRLAATVALRPRPVVIHTYHGHVLEGYFGRVANTFYRSVERRLARVSDCLVAVSQATVDDLVRLRIAPRERFRVVSLGLDLEHLSTPSPAERSRFRAQVGARGEEVLLAYVGRLVPIKRVDVLLRAVAQARAGGAPVRLAVVGDGESRAGLEVLARELGLSDHVAFTGYTLDVRPVLAGCDVAVLSSANEGTPVSLIEAAAAGRPAVATDVGGVPEVVVDGAGLRVPAGDHSAFAAALVHLAGDGDLRRQMGETARKHVLGRFAIGRLVADVEALYTELVQSCRR